MTLKAYNRTTGNEVHIGDDVTDFRGLPGILTRLERGESPGRSGKVVVEPIHGNAHLRYNYDNVWNLRVVDESEHTPRHAAPETGELPYEDSPGARPATVTLTVDEWRDIRDALRDRCANVWVTNGTRGTDLSQAAEWINSKIMEADPAE